MANVDLAGKKTVGSTFTNSVEVVRVIYDNAIDTTITTANDGVIIKADNAIAILGFYVRGITVLDSAADGMTMDVGIDGGDEDILIDGVAEATFAAGALVQPTLVDGTPNVMALPLTMAADEEIIMNILGENLTSGKCEFFFWYTRL